MRSFKLKMHQIHCWPGTPLSEITTPPDPLVGWGGECLHNPPLDAFSVTNAPYFLSQVYVIIKLA